MFCPELVGSCCSEENRNDPVVFARAALTIIALKNADGEGELSVFTLIETFLHSLFIFLFPLL